MAAFPVPIKQSACSLVKLYAALVGVVHTHGAQPLTLYTPLLAVQAVSETVPQYPVAQTRPVGLKPGIVRVPPSPEKSTPWPGTRHD